MGCMSLELSMLGKVPVVETEEKMEVASSGEVLTYIL